MNIRLFMSTEEVDPASAIIRWYTNCDWSHTGWIDLDTNKTYSAMLVGGVKWRPLNPNAKVLVLSAPKMKEAFNKALSQEGHKYDFLDIVGIASGRNWSQPGEFICDKLVFWAYQEIGMPLLNHVFIPLIHLKPRDILLSPLVEMEK